MCTSLIIDLCRPIVDRIELPFMHSRGHISESCLPAFQLISAFSWNAEIATDYLLNHRAPLCRVIIRWPFKMR